MSAGEPLTAALGAALADPVVSSSALGGGSISSALRAELGSGRVVFAKTREGAGRDEFESEAAGLRWLAAGGAAVPEVLASLREPPLLALTWVDRGALSDAGAEQLGRELAALHAAGAEGHGAPAPGSPAPALRIGSLEIEARRRASWAEVYARDRLEPLTRRAYDQGALDDGGRRALERVSVRVDELAGPAETPARLHGDLWSGNVLADRGGRGWLIDPLAHGGHREVDLAMLRLFGAPSERIFSAYAEIEPLAPGHADRVELWQLFPLLVHAILFGGSYGASVRRIAERYA